MGLFFRIWEDPATRDPMLAIVRSAVNNERAAAVFRGLLTRNLLSRVAGRLEGPDAELRVTLAAAQMVGTTLLRYVIRIEPLASEPVAELVARLAPVVQHHLTGPRPDDGSEGPVRTAGSSRIRTPCPDLEREAYPRNLLRTAAAVHRSTAARTKGEAPCPS